ncbi:DUF3048 domain-containing protein [Caldalkalibacillus mannanilyticus]|uniref:DUF3048 domain-containing protein n=1 Tax=Caldalkalibacillus mannanilyticus TaxID=1418 RepID=UPI00046AE6B5|nr:DUF3048 domain-containing protein [Caldalkalibacillus mannanilyticus]
MKKACIGLILVLSFLLLVACGGSDPATQPVEEELGGEPIIEEEETVFPYHAPLTGEGSLVEINDRILAVMINNHGKARPQTGISQADMVYEVLAEGEITRLVALFQSKSPEVIGPVRSLRPYLIDIATGFDAVFAHAGGSPEALQIARNQGLPNLDEIYNAGGSFYRVNFRKAPHNLYTSTELLREGAEKRKYKQDSKIPTLKFKDPVEEMVGEEAGWIDIEYHSSYKVSYEYDAETGLYTRYVRGEPHVDMETTEPLTTTNLFVIETTHKTLDSVGRRAIDVKSEGKGYLFQRGKMTEVDWKRIDGVIRPIRDGEEIGLYPGVTWVNIVPNKPGLENSVRFKASKEVSN